MVGVVVKVIDKSEKENSEIHSGHSGNENQTFLVIRERNN